MISVTPSPSDIAGSPLLYCTLPVEPMAAKQARNFVTEILDERGLPAYVPDAQLVISELATNAINVSRPGDQIAVGVLLYPREIVLLCWDGHSSTPAERHAEDLDESGRGLTIVARLCKDWGAVPWPLHSGKVVWASLARTNR